MKKFFLIVLCLSYFICQAQKSTHSSKNSKYSSATINSSQDSLLHGTCVGKQFSIVFYVVLDSTLPANPNYPGVGAATPANISALITELNNTFRPICVSFANCSTVYIPNFSYGKSWTQPIEPFVTASYYTENTINFYLVDTVYYNAPNELYGYTYEPNPTNLAAPRRDIIVLDKQFLLNGINAATTKHLIGHFFGLPHTFDEINPSNPAPFPPVGGVISHEYSDGSNCDIHGDGFCDTEADPISPLLYPKDGKGVYYLPPIDNIMSNYIQTRCRFTQEQFNYMAYIMTTTRFYLH